jgi:enoyl-CoA hydratase
MSDDLISERHGAVALLRLNRPKRLNALSDALAAEIASALEAADADDTIRAIVITGDERAFAAGADIGELGQPGGPRLEVWDRVWSIRTPIVGAVQGLALGGGLELAMSCDLLVVAENARLGQPEINLGLLPGAGGTQRLAHALGKALAMELVLTGREIDGREAYARGLACACVPAELVLRTALDLAASIAARAPLAVRAAKSAINDAFELPLHRGLMRERTAFRALLETADGREGVAAFREKRRPTWTGA